MSDKVALFVNGQEWNVWTASSISRSLDCMSGEFRLDLTTKPEDAYLSANILPGIAARIEVDGETLIDGYIDGLQADVDGSASRISIAGRDRTCDLIDCAASVSGPFEFANQKLDQIVRKVIAPFGITLTVAADVGKAFERAAIQPGETVYEFLDRLCRYRAVLPISNGIGGLVLIKPGKEKGGGRLVYGENIIEGSIRFDDRDRFSEFVVKAQSENTDDNDAEQAAGGESRAYDKTVKRYRPKLIIADAHGYALTLKQRAEWEAQFSKARSYTCSYKVQGWRAADGALWRINTVIPVSDPVRGIAREMLIVGVAFTKSESGTFTQIDLAPPEAHDLPAEREDEDMMEVGV